MLRGKENLRSSRDRRRNAHVLRGSLNLRIPKLQHHGEERPNCKSASPPNESRLNKHTGNDRPDQARDLVNSVVAPRRVIAIVAHVRSSRFEIIRQEDTVERTDHADNEPIRDDNRGRPSKGSGLEKAQEVRLQANGGPDGLFGVNHISLGAELLEREGKGSVVFGGYGLQVLVDFLISVLAD